MKRVLGLALCMLVVAASTASAQGTIGLFTDAYTYTNCNLIDATVGLCSVYLVQLYPTGISSSMMVVDDSGLTFLNVIVHTPLSIGHIFTGIDFSYGACLGPTVLLATLNYFCQGQTVPCSEISIAPHPETGVITLVDCSATPVTPWAGHLTINGNYTDCPCIPSTCQTCPTPAVEALSWGRIKALYGGDSH